MKNVLGSNLTVTLFGESHGDAIGVVIDGMSPGVTVNREYIDDRLSHRRPALGTDTPRVEPDNYQIVSGVFNDKTTGTPIAIVIPNENTKSKDYNYGQARPAHADYTAFVKYHGNEDYRGGGHFSGRITAGLVAAGAIVMSALEKKGIYIGTHILKCGGIEDGKAVISPEVIANIKSKQMPVIDDEAGSKMQDAIMKVREEIDSIGGVTQTFVYGMPAGVGEPWFDSVESMISHAVFSLGGVKGIEFGLGFEFANMKGSSANDPMRLDNDKVVFESNNNGGINGGITNGMPIIFNCAVKPTPSIAQTQKSIDFIKQENIDLEIKGRHDPAIIRRICPVLDAVCALVIGDLLIQRFGIDYLAD